MNTVRTWYSNTKLALVEIEKLKIFTMHDNMFEFMKKNALYDLFTLVYSN